MEFEGQYLTYEEYKGLGGTLDLMPFNLLEFEARRKVDDKTFNRLKNGVDIPQEVKICEYNLINSIASFSQSLGDASNKGNVKSENTDGYSVTYINPGEISEVVKSKSDVLDDIVRTYLIGVIYNGEHLMYIGV